MHILRGVEGTTFGLMRIAIRRGNPVGVMHLETAYRCEIVPGRMETQISSLLESLVVLSFLETVRTQPMARPMSSARTKGRGERPPEPAGQSSESERRGGSCEEETREWPG